MAANAVHVVAVWQACDAQDSILNGRQDLQAAATPISHM